MLPAPGSETGPGQLRLVLRPRLQPRAGMSVVVELAGPVAARLAAFAIAPRWAGAQGPRNVHDLVVTDGRGNIAVRPSATTGRFALERGPVGGAVRASYFAAADDELNRYDLQVTADGAFGVGHSFLVLPEVDEVVHARLQWDLAELGGARGAASFGVGEDVVADLRPHELAHSVYLAGALTVQDGGFGERLIALGKPRFDPAEALRFSAEALHAARQMFEPEDRQPFTFAFLPQPHMGADHDGASLHRSFALWFDDSRALDDRLKLLVAHEIIHRWIGSRVRLVAEDGRDVTWFSEGMTAHYARTLLHRSGAISSEAFVADLNRSFDAQLRWWESDHRSRATRPSSGAGHPGESGPSSPGTASAARGDRAAPTTGPGAGDPTSGRSGASPSSTAAGAASVPVSGTPHRSSADYHRGALYAARIDAKLRNKQRGSLDELVRDLMEQAAKTPDGALPVAAWRAAIEERLGTPAGREYHRLLVELAAPIDIPPAAFGRCFLKLAPKHASYELGFDPASLDVDPPLIGGVVAGSAAEKAGLADGDVVISGHKTIRLGDPSHTITLVVSGKRGTRVVRYSPQATRLQIRWQLSPKCKSR